jgi:3'-5' exoribonuclease
MPPRKLVVEGHLAIGKTYPIRPRPGLPCPAVFVREMNDGAELDQVLLVREAELRRRRDGAEYLRLQLGDRTGAVAAVVWDGVADCTPHAQVGAPARVVGRFARHPRYGAQITVRALAEPAPGTFVLDDLLDGPPKPVGEMEAELRELLETVREPHLRALLERVFGEGSELRARFRDAPAAKHYHQAYRHGLLEHALSVGQAAHLLCVGPFADVDHDVAVTGALLHDIGKLDAYTSGDAIDLSDAGRLQGEIPLGYYRVRRLCEEIEAFPPHLAEQVLHIILSHHGALEHGSPVVPCTREATLVHFLDNLGGRLGSFDRLEKELPEGAAWSPFDRAIGSGAYFASRAAPAERAAAA